MENETVASVGPLIAIADSRHPHKDVYQVEVFCSQIGDTEITYRVGNIASSSNMLPVKASEKIKVMLFTTYREIFRTKSMLMFQVSCTHPGQIYLVPEVRLPDDTKVPCPIDSATQRITAQSYLDLKIITVLKDEKGRKLDSFSSVDLEWTISNPELGKLNKEGIVVQTNQVDGYPTIGKSNF